MGTKRGSPVEFRDALQRRRMTAGPARKIEFDRLLEARAPEIAEDPRVRPTIRIGGIGHRRVEAQTGAKIAATVGRLLRQVRKSGESALRHPQAVLEFVGTLDIFVITPLAEGADRLIAQAALANHCQLGAVIPFSEAEYETTFDLSPVRGPAIEEFRGLLAQASLPRGYGVLVLDGLSGDENTRTKSFRDCGKAVMRWSDILIAVLEADRWKSETGLCVQEAINRGMPVIVIDPNTPDAFSLSLDGAILSSGTDVDAALELSVALLLGTAGPRTAEASERTSHAVNSYRDEMITCDEARPCDFEHQGPFTAGSAAPWWISWFSGANRLVAGLIRVLFRLNRFSGASRKGRAFHAWDLPFETETAGPFVELFLRHHRADVAASTYAELHRSAQILTAMLGIIVSTIAISDAIARPSTIYPTLVELGCLLYAILIVAMAHQQRWLARWIDYRLIAEVLRNAKFLLVCGHPVSFVGFGHYAGVTGVEHNWTYEHCRHVLRALRIAVPSRCIEANSNVLKTLTNYLVDQCIDGQIAYHQQTAAFRSAAEHLLQYLTIIVVVMSVATVVLKFFFFNPVLQVAAILLPTVAGALLAMRGYGEHSLVARRSSAVISALVQRRSWIEKSQTLSQLEEQMAIAAQTLLRDVDGWLELFADKHIEL